jgi:hypothetical protein
MILALIIYLWGPTKPANLFTPVHRHIALETQKSMLFEYGQPFKLHRRSRAELLNASLQR